MQTRSSLLICAFIFHTTIKSLKFKHLTNLHYNPGKATNSSIITATLNVVGTFFFISLTHFVKHPVGSVVVVGISTDNNRWSKAISILPSTFCSTIPFNRWTSLKQEPLREDVFNEVPAITYWSNHPVGSIVVVGISSDNIRCFEAWTSRPPMLCSTRPFYGRATLKQVPFRLGVFDEVFATT